MLLALLSRNAKVKKQFILFKKCFLPTKNVNEHFSVKKLKCLSLTSLCIQGQYLRLRLQPTWVEPLWASEPCLFVEKHLSDRYLACTISSPRLYFMCRPNDGRQNIFRPKDVDQNRALLCKYWSWLKNAFLCQTH
jgi:hypothetical protein